MQSFVIFLSLSMFSRFIHTLSPATACCPAEQSSNPPFQILGGGKRKRDCEFTFLISSHRGWVSRGKSIVQAYYLHDLWPYSARGIRPLFPRKFPEQRLYNLSVHPSKFSLLVSNALYLAQTLPKVHSNLPQKKQLITDWPPSHLLLYLHVSILIIII